MRSRQELASNGPARERVFGRIELETQIKSPVVWRLIVDEPADGVRNMATDHGLFERVQAGGRPVLRLYRWDPPCLSLGRNQQSHYDAARVAAAGATLVRRPTGGSAVYHDRELTYAVMAPVAVVGRPRAAFVRISEAIAAALRSLRVPATIAGCTTGQAPRPDAAHPCFASPVQGEVVAEGRKLVGSAQRCERQIILQHGSLLLDGDQSVMSAWLAHDKTDRDTMTAATAGTTAVTVRTLIEEVPAWTTLCSALVEAIEHAFRARLEADQLTEAERLRVRALEAHYASEAWTWRH